jgi:predicted alpha/beta superfamily hydrolase
MIFAALAAVVAVGYPGAGHHLTLRTSADWGEDVELRRIDDDHYQADVAAGEFKVMLDGQWSIGANYTVRDGATKAVAPRFFSHQGKVFTLDGQFHSAILNNARPVRVYLPPGYDENRTARYPVLYMHDGQNVFGGGWMVDHALDALYEGNDPPAEAIVVAVDNIGSTRFAEYTPTPGGMGGGHADDYLRMLLEELKPRIDRTFRTRPEARSTGIAGSSLGGLLSLYAATSRPDDFGFIGAFSPSTWWDDAWIVPRVADLTHASPRPARVYVDCGGPNDGGADTVKLPAAFAAAGYHGASFKYVEENGAPHNETSWSRRFPAAARFLLGPR